MDAVWVFETALIASWCALVELDALIGDVEKTCKIYNGIHICT